MAKKSKNKINIILNSIALIFAVVSICMIFTEVCGINIDGELGYVLTGLQATFGYSKQTAVLGSTVTTTYTMFSFMNLLTYILLVAGVVVMLLRMFKVLKSSAVEYLAAIMFIVAGVLYFVLPNFVIYGNGWADLVELAIKADGIKTTLIGGIIGGVSAVLAGAMVLAKKFVTKK